MISLEDVCIYLFKLFLPTFYENERFKIEWENMSGWGFNAILASSHIVGLVSDSEDD